MHKFTRTLTMAAVTLAVANTAFAADKVLTVSHWAGPNHAMATMVFPWMNEQYQACSGGTLSLKIENGLAPPPAQYDTVRDGVADIGWIVHGYTPGKFVTTKIAELPGNSGNAESMSIAFQRTHDKYLAAAKEAKGVEVLANFVHGPGMLNTLKPISSYKDVEGMKLRVGGGVANLVGTALGVAGVNVPAPAVYETIASGVAEGVFFPGESLYSFKIAELIQHAYKNPDGMYTTSFAVLMNSDSYDDLSDEHKACVDATRGEALAGQIGKFWDEADTIGVSKAKEEFGLVITEAGEEDRAYFTELTSGIEAEVLQGLTDRGVDAQAALEYLRSQQ
jgi:TRAP-type C4-dicarboxylate transport system substrate-binding protein